jgi:hypothetical protein
MQWFSVEFHWAFLLVQVPKPVESFFFFCMRDFAKSFWTVAVLHQIDS